jgi:hypothetical protein
MTEEFLHYLWKFSLLTPNLSLVSGEPIKIINAGIHNTDSGPDFLNARIKIDNTTWAGNIEIHIKSSDWFAHKHHLNKAYDNIILHVVFQNDIDVKTRENQKVPTLEIEKRFNSSLFDRYQDFMISRNWIACEKMIAGVDRFVSHSWLDRMLVERLETKATEIQSQLRFNKNNWERTFYEFLARNFGFKVNSLPFDLLAKSISLSYLAKHKDNLLQIESLFFGQAGLLPAKPKDEYSAKLCSEYNFLKTKYKLTPMDAHLWRFMRLRPSNFPTIRIAQFAGLVHKSSHLFAKILEKETIKDMISLFEISVSQYWQEHFNFGKKSTVKFKKLGTQSIYLIHINTVIPFIFIYGHSIGNQSLIDRSLRFLEQIPGESNSVTRKWDALGMSCRTAFSTQALIQLKTEYCARKKCLECGIGNYFMKQVGN